MESKKVSILNKFSFWSLIGTLFFAIFFFIPYTKMSLEVSKGFLVAVGATLSLFFWLVARLSDGKLMIPRDRILLFAFFIPIIFLVSSLFSVSPYLSLFGRGFESGTFGMMLVFFIIMLLCSIYFQRERSIRYFFNSIYLAAGIIAFIEILSIFVNVGALVPNFFSSIAFGNLFGTWNDFALFFGGVIILSLISFEFKSMSGKYRLLLSILTIISLFFLSLVNNMFTWMLVEFFALLIFIYSLSFHRTKSEENPISEIQTGREKERNLPIMTLFVVLVCLVFIVGNKSIGSFLPSYFNVSSSEIAPSLSSTSIIIKKSISHNPFLGTGPNTFAVDWSMWKPADVSKTQFWNIDFPSGSSGILTYFVTTGILGILVWALFLISFTLRGIQSFKVAFKNKISDHLIVGPFLLAVYFWVATIFSNPNAIILMLAFASSGVFIGVLVYKRMLSVNSGSFLNDPKGGFFSIFLLVVLMIASILTLYVHVGKFIALSYYSNASASDSSLESLMSSEKKVLNSIIFDKNDVYYRNLSQIYVNEMGALISDKNSLPDTLKSNLQILINKVEQASNEAIKQNPKYYINFKNAGDIYAALLGLGLSEESYQASVDAYDKALALSPNSPSIILARAQLEMIHKNNTTAREFIDKALEMKPDYIDAIFTLAQIETNEGKSGEAIKQAVRASELAPNDATVFYRLGILRYNAGDYSGAINAFKTAVVLSPDYLNARYFLGLSYQKAGNSTDAKAQFDLLKQILPDNKEITDALSSLTENKQ